MTKCISQNDLEKLLELHKSAQTTPMIKFSSDPKEEDLSTLAWNVLRDFQIELGKKYQYDWEKIAIDRKGEIIQI